MNQEEPKFRAWNVEKKKWVYFDLGDLAFSNPKKWAFVDIQNATQYISLHDSKGKEIYVGDVCKNELDEIGEIQLSNTHYWFVRKDDKGKPKIGLFEPYMVDGEQKDKLEIIGNIYESPEFFRTLEQ